MGTIKGDDMSFEELIKVFNDKKVEYKTNLTKLEETMTRVTSGALKGTLADSILDKFVSKKETFNALAKSLESSEDYSAEQKAGFDQMVDNALDSYH